MPEARLYTDLAHLWPLLSPPEDYAQETETIRRVLHEKLGNKGRISVLELGAGGGHALSHLTDEYDCTAVDLSETMLDNCRQLNPTVTTHVGDMRTVRLNRAFDAVLIHDAIDYMLSEKDVRSALATAAAHLNPKGIVLVAPTYVRETFVDHQAEHDQHRRGDLTLTYLSYVHDPDPADTTFEMLLNYVINEAGRVRTIEDRHTCGLFSIEQWRAMMTDAGFDVEIADDDLPWTLFVGIKR